MAIEYYQFQDNGSLQSCEKNDEYNWIVISAPTSDEIQSIAHKYKILLDFLTDPLDMDEGARVDFDSETVQIILRVPILEKNDDSDEYTTAPVAIITSSKFNILLTGVNINLMQSFIRPGQSNLNATPSRLILCFIENVIHRYLQFLRYINQQQDLIENQLVDITENEKLLKLLHLKKGLVHFTTSLKGNNSLMTKLQKHLKIKEEKDLDLLDDITIDTKQAIEMSEIFTTIIISTMNTISSIISNKISFTMKVLTSFTILLMVPTLITSFYGMNISGLPLQDNAYSFYLVTTFCVIVSVICIFILRRKKWL